MEVIFAEAVHEPRHYYDPSIYFGSDNPWLRILHYKKGLALVCKATYWSGMRILYREVSIRRMGQIPALANTLRSSESGEMLLKMISHLSMDQCVVLAPCAEVVREDLAWILTHCTALKAISFRVHESFPIISQPQDIQGSLKDFGYLFNPSWLLRPYPIGTTFSSSSLIDKHIAFRLSSLHLSTNLSDDSVMQGVHELLRHATHLERLQIFHAQLRPDSLSVSDAPSVGGTIGCPNTEIELPYLVSLTVDLDGRNDMQEYVSTQWRAPRLQRLAVLLNPDCKSPKALLERLGRRLLYLHIFAPGEYATALDDEATSQELRNLAPALDVLLPNLQHLVMPYFRHITRVMKFSRLRTLDVWVSYYGREVAPLINDIFTDVGKNIPASANLRCLFIPDNDLEGVGWPEHCVPELVSKDGERVAHRFPSRWVLQTASVVAATLPLQSKVAPDFPQLFMDEFDLNRINEDGYCKKCHRYLYRIDALEKRLWASNLGGFYDDSEDEESSDSEFSDSGADKLFVDKDEVWPEEVSSPEEQLDREAILEAFAQSQRINEDA